MASERQDSDERALLGRLATRVAGEFDHLVARMSEHLDRIDEIAGDRAEVQDELADGRQLLSRSAALVRQLAAFGGHRQLAPEPTDLRTQAGSWWPRLQGAIGPSHALELHLRGGPVALVDPELLGLALENLCLNARDASPAGATIELHIESQPANADADSPGTVLIEIVDHGPGMAPELQAQALDAFFTTKPRHAGLGLSAARAIVEGHDGRLTLRSAPGAGTRVRIELPLAAPSHEPDEAGGEARVRVLLIHTEKLIVRWMQRSLTSKGCIVWTAGHVLEARTQLSEADPELVIVDRTLPDGDGRVFALELAHDRPACAVLFTTSRGQRRRDQDRGLSPLPGSIEVLERPFSTRRFDALVGPLLDRIRTRNPSN